MVTDFVSAAARTKPWTRDVDEPEAIWRDKHPIGITRDGYLRRSHACRRNNRSAIRRRASNKGPHALQLAFPLQRDLDRFAVDAPLTDCRTAPYPGSAIALPAMMATHRHEAFVGAVRRAHALVVPVLMGVALGLRRLAPIRDFAAETQ